PSPRQLLVEIRAEIRNVVGMYLGPRQRRTYWQRLQAARRDQRRRGADKVRRPWPARKPHKPPRPPKILKMGTDLKALMEQTLANAEPPKCWLRPKRLVLEENRVDKQEGSSTTAGCTADTCYACRGLPPWPSYPSSPGAATPPPSSAAATAMSPTR